MTVPDEILISGPYTVTIRRGRDGTWSGTLESGGVRAGDYTGHATRNGLLRAMAEDAREVSALAYGLSIDLEVAQDWREAR